MQVHRLVAIAFVHNPNPSKYKIVNHKDENKRNPNSDNLEWCTTYYNSHYKDNSKKRIKLSNYKLQTAVIQLDISGAIIKEYKNISHTPHYEKGFSKICTEGGYYKGYYWRYKDEYKN